MNERFARANAIAHVDLAHEPEFALGRIRVRPAHCELVGAGWRDTLEARVMQVLVALARANGEVVARDDLTEACWESRIVSEASVGRCIGRLRKAGEASGNAFAIETVSRVGYRLRISDVETPAPDASRSAPPEADSIAADRAAPPAATHLPSPAGSLQIVAAVAAGVFVLLTTGFGVWWLGSKPAVPPAEPSTSVAVLPFANMSGDPAKDYFSDGFSEELLNDLSADPHLHVVARTSAFAFKGRNGDTQAIARALHVHDIVEGSVREMGNRVRITAELIDVGNGYNIWSASYDRDLADILSVQREVARAVAVALTHKILPFAAHAPTIDPAVYRLYLEGRHQLDLISPAGFTKAYPLLKEVTIRESHFADGLAGFSRAAWGYSQFDSLHGAVIVAEAKDAAAKALLLAPRNIEARELRGTFELDEWNWKAAASDFRSLEAESPNHLRVIGGLRVYYRAMGFPDEAVAVMERAWRSTPFRTRPGA